MAGKNFPKKFAVLFARASTAVRSGIDPRAVRSSASKVVESMVPKFIRSRRILTPVLGTVQRIMRPMRIRPIRDTRHGGFAFVASICRVDHCTLYCLCLSNRLSCFSLTGGCFTSAKMLTLVQFGRHRVLADPQCRHSPVVMTFARLNVTGLKSMGGPITDCL